MGTALDCSQEIAHKRKGSGSLDHPRVTLMDGPSLENRGSKSSTDETSVLGHKRYVKIINGESVSGHPMSVGTLNSFILLLTIM